jgi:hypothetical protein
VVQGGDGVWPKQQRFESGAKTQRTHSGTLDTTMHPSATSLLKAPYGLAFAVEELLQIRQWAEHRNLRMMVALDQVLDNAEFEEMVILAPPHRRRRTLTIWRTVGSVFMQTPNGRPRAFTTLEEGLAALRPARAKGRSWLSLLGFGG